MPIYLSKAEREMGKTSLAALDRSWRLTAGQPLRATNYIEIGALSDEQAVLLRYLVRQLIQQHKDASYIASYTFAQANERGGKRGNNV